MRQTKRSEVSQGLHQPLINHIVVVDDDLITGILHKQLVARCNTYTTVVSFNNPAQALDYIISNAPDLLLLDMNMPEIDGILFLQKLEQSSIRINVVFITGSVDPEERAKAATFSCVRGILDKPLTYQKIEEFLL